MADIERTRMLNEDSPDRRIEREGSRESDHDDRDRRRRGSSYERDLKRESRRYSPYPSREERDIARGKTTSAYGNKVENRIFVSNLRYTVKWQDLKDYFKKVGEVGFAEILEDESGKSRGCGVVEFKNSDDAVRAIKEVDGTEWLGRTLHCREDRASKLSTSRSSSSRSASSSRYLSSGGGGAPPGLMTMGNMGLLQGITYTNDPSSCTVFVSNLDYKISWQKLKDTFRMAGHVIRAEVSEDDQKKSKGYGTVQFETALEALNAVHMFHGQVLQDRAMSVRLDRNATVAKQLNNLGVNLQMPSRGGSDTSSMSMANPNSTPAGGLNPMAIMQLLQSLQNLQGLVQLAGLAGASSGLASATAGGSSDSSGFNALNMQNMGGLGALANLASSAGMMAGTGNLAGMSFNSNSGNSISSGLSGSMMTSPSSSFSQSTGSSSGKQVFVRNLPWKYTWQNLKDKFREAGKVVRADIMTEDSGRSKGCGIVVFERSEDATHAINLFNGVTVDGRELDVRLDKFA